MINKKKTGLFSVLLMASLGICLLFFRVSFSFAEENTVTLKNAFIRSQANAHYCYEALDLDTGSIVSTSDSRGDLTLLYGPRLYKGEGAQGIADAGAVNFDSFSSPLAADKRYALAAVGHTYVVKTLDGTVYKVLIQGLQKEDSVTVKFARLAQTTLPPTSGPQPAPQPTPQPIVPPVTQNGQTNLVATPGDGKIFLKWMAPQKHDVHASNLSYVLKGYYVYRSMAPDREDGTKLNDFPVTGEEYTDTIVKDGVTYYYRIRAVMGDGSVGDFSNEASAKPIVAPTSTPSTLPAGSGAFTTTGSMNAARGGHTATLLPDGRVLFTGDLFTSEKSAEIYDPATGKSTVIEMGEKHNWFHTATLFSNGKVLIAGNSYASEIFDPSRATFSSTGRMNTTRGGHTATLLPGDKVLITGGQNAPKSAEIYNPATGKFTYTWGMMKEGRGYHTATLLRNGKVLITGGEFWSGARGYSLSSAELYNPATGTFTSTGSMNTPRGNHTATLLADGRVLVTGGANGQNPLKDAEIYDPATGKFTSTRGVMTDTRMGHTATLLPNGRVLIASGSKYPSAEIFDPATETFTETGRMNVVHVGYHTATLLPNGKVLIAGGVLEQNTSTSSVELFDYKALSNAPGIERPESPEKPKESVQPENQGNQAGKGKLWCNKGSVLSRVGYSKIFNYTGSLLVEGTTLEGKPFTNVLPVVTEEGPLAMELPFGKYKAQYQANYLKKDGHGYDEMFRVRLQLIEFTIDKEHPNYSWEPRRM